MGLKTDAGGATYQEIAEALGVSNSMAQHVEKQALAKLREALKGLDLLPEEPRRVHDASIYIGW